MTFLLAQRLRSGKSVPPILLLLLLAGAEVIGSCYLLSACRSEKSLQCILIFWTRKNVQNLSRFEAEKRFLTVKPRNNVTIVKR